MGLRLGDEVPLRIVMEGVAIASANDAATALAEHLGGRRGPVRGAHEREGPRARPHRHPLREPARAAGSDAAHERARHGDADRPAARRPSRTRAPCSAGRRSSTRAASTRATSSSSAIPGGVQALKTGFTREAGYNLAVSAWRNGQQFLMIVLGASSRQASFLDAKKLLLLRLRRGRPRASPQPTRRVEAHQDQAAKLRPRRATLSR